jgi:hypothetical protein
MSGKKRSHRNTTRLTAKERARAIVRGRYVSVLGPVYWENLERAVQRAIQAAVRSALARKARR